MSFEQRLLDGCLWQDFRAGPINRRIKTNPAERDQYVIEKLPNLPSSKKQLLKIVEKCLQNRRVVMYKPAEYQICPDCGNPSEYFQQQAIDDEGYPILIISCPACGWIQGMAMQPKQQPLVD